MKDQRRITVHSSRTNKQGRVFSAKHNDRSFDLSHAAHIDPDRTNGNIYWHVYDASEAPNMTFEEAESKFYAEHFGEALEAQNERHRLSRHKERIRDTDQIRLSKETAPAETLYYIGSQDFNPDPSQLRECFEELLEWKRSAFPQVVCLDWALHLDETTPHIHEREVFVAHDPTGREIPIQRQCFKEMGIEPPNPEKKEDRFNNRKMTYTRMIRDKFADICRARGLEFTIAPREASKSGLSLLEYESNCEQERTRKFQYVASCAQRDAAQEYENLQYFLSENERLIKENEAKLAEAERLNTEIEAKQVEAEGLNAEIEAKRAEVKKLKTSIRQIYDDTSEQAVEELFQAKLASPGKQREYRLTDDYGRQQLQIKLRAQAQRELKEDRAYRLAKLGVRHQDKER